MNLITSSPDPQLRPKVSNNSLMADLEKAPRLSKSDSAIPNAKKQVSSTKLQSKAEVQSKRKEGGQEKESKRAKALDLNLNEFIQKLLVESKDKAATRFDFEKLPTELRTTAAEIQELLGKANYEISEKFNLSLMSNEITDALISETENLSLALKSYSLNRNTSAWKVIRSTSFSSLDNFELFSKLSSKHYLVPRNVLPQIYEDLIATPNFRKASVVVQIRTVSFLAKRRINPAKTISAIGNITTDFNQQDENFQVQVIENLRKWDVSSVYQFLTHMDSDRIRVALCTQLAEDLTPAEIAKFFSWANPDSSYSKIGIYKRIIIPAADNFIKWNNKLEDLLILWPHLANPENGFNVSQLKVKFKLLIGKPGYLPESLRDESVPLLQGELQDTKDSLAALEVRADDLGKKLSLVQALNEEISQELNDLRKHRQENTRDAHAANESIQRQIKVDLLRQLIPIFELALSGDDQEEFMKILEHQRIEMVGRIGQKVRWNPQICESLTGAEIAEGIIVKTGFTWFSGKEVIPLRRMLIKPE
jgi:hypothetical protein